MVEIADSSLTTLLQTHVATGATPTLLPPAALLPSGGFRGSLPPSAVIPQLGPLADLPGTWVGKGFNVVAVPDKQNGNIFRVIANATSEFITFALTGAPIPNRGSIQDDIKFLGVHYFQQVVDAATSGGLHLETGMWLNLPANDKSDNHLPIVRMSTIPHGDALLAQGVSLTVDGGPQINPVDITPFTIDATTGARQNVTASVYLQPYHTTQEPAGVPANSIFNPNLVIEAAVAHQKITKTIVLIVNAMPVGGINGTPVTPKPDDVGGIVNIPFVKANANANTLSVIFWIETVDNGAGDEFLQLQYTQTTILEFAGLKWPHISVGTLVKQ